MVNNASIYYASIYMCELGYALFHLGFVDRNEYGEIELGMRENKRVMKWNKWSYIPSRV